MAPMTPATAFDTPPEDEPAVDDPVDPLEPDRVVAAQMPVELPHALHQDAWSPIANLFISVTKLLHGITVSFWPNSGYAVRGFWAAVPLEKRKRTEMSSLEGYEVFDTVAFVTSSKVMDEA